MDDNLPIEIHARQFSQSDAATICGIPNARINNWIQRGQFPLPVTEETGTRARRLFSIVDIAKLDLMDRVATAFGASPSVASAAAKAMDEYLSHYSLPEDKEGKHFEVWAWVTSGKSPFEDEYAVNHQLVWYKANKGFFQYHPNLFDDEEPEGSPPVTALSIPISTIFLRIFLKCAEMIGTEYGQQPTGDLEGIL